ncbi:hypothetical protein AWW66_22055 [Micromonospora rosaria]|uniref:Uncharacterized protein n=1 Tax=Micromonospora rosaria TaxID=47874 RepID=A0A136PNH7_9ACTN|nr:hypothetical protein AWW66_22055 [Micromonospora rosaria]
MRTGGEIESSHAKASAAMEILFLLFLFLALAAASALGLTVDSRDSADWRSTDEGRRLRPGAC